MKTKTLIAPSILSADLANLSSELDTIGTADFVHYDVMDGRFVPSISYGQDMLAAVKRSTALPLDVHLMVDEPERCYESFLDAGADVLTFHAEASRHWRVIVDGVHRRNRKVGIALNPETPVTALESIVRELDLVLVLSVNPGLGGQAFMESTYDKLASLARLCKASGASPVVEVDGGVSERNAAELASAGASMLVAGTAVFGSDDRGKAIERLRNATAA